MDRADVLHRLERTEIRVVLGNEDLNKQRRAIDALRNAGSDTIAAEEALAAFEKQQAALIADRDALLEQLARGG